MRKEEPDPIMDEVVSTRRKISAQYGNDPSRYIAAIREKLRYSKIPKGLQGVGISFIITGLMGIAFMAFMGIKL